MIGRRVICLSVLLCFPAALQAESRLIFPRVVLQQGRFTGVAIANPTGSAAILTLRAYRDDGTLFSGSGVVNPRNETIAPGEQYVRLGAQIFNVPASVAEAGTPTYLWMEVSSPTDGLTGFFLDANNAVDFMDGADLAGTGADLVLPLIENNAASTTEISLVNPDDSAARVVLDFVRADGSTVATQTVNLPGRAALHAALSTAFAISYAEVAAVRLRSDRAVTCYGYIHRQTDNSTVTLAAQSHGLSAKTLYFPQLAEGDAWSTQLGLLNFGRVQVLANITAYKPDGTLFGAPTVTANPVSRTIAPDGVLRVDLKSLFGFAGSSLQVGWIKVETNRQALHGNVEYGAGSNRALVMAQVESYERSIFSHQALAPPFFTGLSVLNTANVAANIEVVSLTQGGAVVGRTQRVLRGRQREALLIQEWIPAAAGISGGSVFVKSDQPVVATQLFGTQSFSALANVPPQKVTTNFDPAAHLPHLRVFPPLAVVETGKTKQFTGEGLSGAGWLVNDVAGGNSSLGTVSPTGLYSAPAVAPAQRTFTIRAADTANQSAGASVDVVQRETLVAGLTQLTAVAYLENLHRFFLAEQQILTSIVVDGSSPRATTTTARISEQSSSGTTAFFAKIDNETIGKMLPFVDAAGASYILIAGTDLGKIYRLHVLNKTLDTVASGLNKPNSLALDPISRNLLVSEEGANQITVVERSRFDPLAAAAVVTDPEWRKRPQALVAVPSPRGVAVDGCGGAVYTTSADGQLREYKGNRVRTVFAGLNNPNEILVLYREGYSSCQEALSLLVVVNNEVLQVFPQTGQAITFLSGIANALDLVFFPKASPFITQGEQAVGLAEAPPGAAASRISDVRIGGLYENVGAQAAPPAEPSVSKLPFQDPRGDTFAGSATTANNLQAPDLLSIGAQQLSGSTAITLTFARPVAPLSAAAANSISGFVDFDLRPSSGVASRADSYNSFAPTGMGVDYYVDLSAGVLRDVAASRDTPITLQFLGENLTLQIPLSVVDLSGARMALVVGNRLEITDLAPNAGVIEFIAPAAACSEGIRIIDANLDAAVRRALNISSTAVITCDIAQTLTSLDAIAKGIKSLAGLENFTNLQVLNVAGNSISDLTPLSGLTNLTSLGLGCIICEDEYGAGSYENFVNDVSPLASLKNLKSLGLGYNLGVNDLQPLSALTQLEFLGLEFNSITDLSPLSKLTNLKTLNLGANRAITDITPLAGLTELTTLGLHGNAIVNIAPLSSLTSLQLLSLSRNALTDIAPLAGLVRLTQMALDDNKIASITPLAGLVQLIALGLDANKVTSIAALSSLTGLQYLDLADNSVSDIGPVSGMTKMKYLSLGGNKIADLSPLAPLTALEHLDLTDYNFVSSSTGGNTFSNLSPLAGMKALQELDLSGNEINNINPLSGLTSLKTLVLYNCPISDITSLLLNLGLGTGDTIDLRYNNLTATHCPDLKTLVGRGAEVKYEDQRSGKVTCP